MYCVRSLIVIAMFLSVSVSSASTNEMMKRIRVKLDGKYCGGYLGDVEQVLVKINGVQSVNLEAMKGHAIIEVASDKVKANQLIEAVQTVKGNGWHCTAELMRETGKLYKS